jgi:hypothetical protein
MIFVEGNLLERIEDALQVRMTMTNGELFTVEDFVEPFAEGDRHSATAVIADELSDSWRNSR